MYRSSAENMPLNPNEPLSNSRNDEETEEAVEAYSENDDGPISRSIAPAEPPVVTTSG
jgi:hypothetical protein